MCLPPLSQASLAYVSRHVLGATLAKDEAIAASNWERLTLTKEQVRAAGRCRQLPEV